MKYSAQVIYTDFIELFDINIDDNNLDIKLSNISGSKHQLNTDLILDLSSNVKESYSVFPYEIGDLAIIQIGNTFVLVNHTSTGDNWYKFNSDQITKYLFDSNITDSVIRCMKEDQQLLLNSVLSDFIRNDYSYSDLNKKIKYIKLSILLSFIKHNLNLSFDRIVLDESVLGDVELNNIATSFRFSGMDFLKLVKINNITKVVALLKKEGIINQEFHFVEDTFFLNEIRSKETVKLVFSDKNGMKFDYQLLSKKNYIFDLGMEKDFIMNVGNIFKQEVKGKVFVFNGDDRDLLIS